MNRFLKNYFKGVIAGGGLLLFLESVFFQKYFFVVKEFAIGEGRNNLPLRLIHLTDLHLKKKLWPVHKKLAGRINGLNPDLLLISGDVIDKTGHADTLNAFLSLVNKSIPKAAITGNHEYLSNENLNQLKKIYEKHNGTLLMNASRHYVLNGTRMVITGMDDFIEGNGNFHAAVRGVTWEANHIALLHNPQQFDKIKIQIKKINEDRTEEERLNISYFFAGHTHGGQVRLGNIVPVLPKGSGNYVEGWYNKEKPYLFLFKGFGTSTVPFRFNARSEITLFHYYPSQG